MTVKETEEFQDNTLKLIGDTIEMIKRLQTPHSYIPCEELIDLLHETKYKLDVYYRYVQIDYCIEKAIKGE